MNGERRRKNKPRACSIPEEVIIELAKTLMQRALSWKEVTDFINTRCHKNWNLENILCVLDTRGYKVAEGYKTVSYGKKTYYRIYTNAEYERIAEEHQENAKRRLLAAVSY